MSKRLTETILLVITIAGATAISVAFYYRCSIRAEYVRCIAKVGRFEIEDDEKIHLKRLRPEDPMQFAWRCYVPPLPPNSGVQTKGYVGNSRCGGNWSNSYEGKESTIRVAIRRTKAGPQACGNDVVVRIEPPEVARFVADHWQELEFDAAATD